MSSSSTVESVDLSRAEYLKEKLREFATTGPLKEYYELHNKLFTTPFEEADELEIESVVDSFLFDWIDDYNASTIDYFLESAKGLTNKDQNALVEWKDSINSIFEIKSLGKNSLRLRDLDEEDDFTVILSQQTDELPFKRGHCIAARLLPLGEQFIFSDFQIIFPNRKSAMEAVQVRRDLYEAYSPEVQEKALQEQCTAFCEFFGCNEYSLAPVDLNSKLLEFQNFLLAERRDPETGMTPLEKFKAKFGHDFEMPEPGPIPNEFEVAGEVTILCDDFDGLVLLPDYQRFKRVFASANPDRDVTGWRDLVEQYIKDPDIPIVAFERVAEQNPKRVQKVLRDVLGDKKFSIEHLYAELLHYKQPVEGLDAEDDRKLWDMFEGNTQPASKPKASGKTRAASAKKTSSASKKKPRATTKRKPAAANRVTTRKTTSRKTGTKGKAAKVNKPTSRSSARVSAGKKTSAKKR
jgi:hypothetical protein